MPWARLAWNCGGLSDGNPENPGLLGQVVPVSPVIACRGCRCRWFYGIRAFARGANCSGFLLPSPSQLIKPFPAGAFLVGACLLGLCRRQDFERVEV